MQLEDQFISLELSKKLKMLNVKQDSLFYFVSGQISKDYYAIVSTQFFGHIKDIKTGLISYPELTDANMLTDIDGIEIYSAFLASELLEMTPVMAGFGCELMNGIDIQKYKRLWCARYYNHSIIPEPSDSIPNAVAELIIYLIENNFWKPEK
jgi:hypothetical protein